MVTDLIVKDTNDVPRTEDDFMDGTIADRDDGEALLVGPLQKGMLFKSR